MIVLALGVVLLGLYVVAAPETTDTSAAELAATLGFWLLVGLLILGYF